MRRAYSAEFLGTFQLVFIGTGSIVLAETQAWNFAQLWIGLAFGFAVFLGITLFGKVSGAHMNPAVTIALWVKGDFHRKDVPYYLFFQFAGAIVATAFLSLIYPDHSHYGDTLPKIGTWQSFVLEFGLTAVLMLGVVLDLKWKSTVWQAGLFIGAIVGMEAYFAGPFCGASMNPARSLSPGIFSGMLSDVWIYLIATTLGASLVAYLFKK